MPLFIPKLRYDARPPLYWPIQPSWKTSVQGLCIVLRLSFLHFLFLLVLIVPSSSPTSSFSFAWWLNVITVRPLMQRYLLLTVVDTIMVLTGAFYFTANIMLRRTKVLMDRYSGYREYGKLILTGLFLLMIGIDNTSLSLMNTLPNPFDRTTFYQLFVSTCRFTLYHCLPLFIGLHFAYGDSSPVLQSFGVKFSSPSSWIHCQGTDHIIGFIILLFGSLSMILIYTHFPLQALYHQYIIYGLYGSIFLCLFLLPSVLLSKRYTMHLHHYFCVGLLLPLTSSSTMVSRYCIRSFFGPIVPMIINGVPSVESTELLDTFSAVEEYPTVTILTSILRSLLFGIMIDGIAVWGMDPIWIPYATNHDKDGYSLETIQKSDTTTLVWLHLLPLVSSPLSYYILLDELRTLYTTIEPIILQRYKNDTYIMQELQFQLLQRRHTVDQDFTYLCSLLNQPLRTDVQFPSSTTYDKSILRNLLHLLVNRLQSPDKDQSLATVFAIFRTLFFGPFAGSRELRLQCRLHLQYSSVRLQQTLRSLDKLPNREAKTVNYDTTETREYTATALYSYSSMLDTDEECFTNLHENLRKLLDEYEHKLPSLYYGKGKKLYDTESIEYIYWSTQKYILDYLEYSERTLRTIDINVKK